MNKKNNKYDSCSNPVRCKKEDKKKLDKRFKELKEKYYNGSKDYYVNLEEVRNSEN